MPSAKIVLGVLTILAICTIAPLISQSSSAPVQLPAMASEQTPAQSAARPKHYVIAASTVLDGKGGMLRDVRIVAEGNRIAAIYPASAASKSEPIDYDLRGLTVLPGWIDAHTHITWSFGPDGKNANQGAPTEFLAYAAEGNAYATLMAGFTTIQSLGSAADIPLRNAIASGRLPGPRILTSAEPLMGQGEKSGTPDEIRAYIRKQKDAGADLIKIFASGGMSSDAMTLSQEQLNAACDEARKLGLRSLVHAIGDPAVRAAVVAGCTEVEHGLRASDDTLKLMAEKGIWLDPQAGLLLETYLANKEKYLAPPYFPESAFARMAELIPAHQDFIKRALKIPGLKIVYGTDAVAGAHGHNAEDFIHRVRDAGVDPIAAMVSANSLNAEAMGLGNQIGSIAQGMQADIIALDGDPLKDITAVRKVIFVMKSGVVYKNVDRGRQ
ncbi:MAG TPA: amidohydrolase family protein [Candidatus Acidoferrum sp.]|nr:amidohydrolase family protein [Candidatus Acidoferrum sp.]